MTLDPSLHFYDYGGLGCFSGQVETVQAYNSPSYVGQMINSPGNNRILVIDAGGLQSNSGAVFGGPMAATALRNGWKGIIVNGLIRHASQLATTQFGVKALGTSPTNGSGQGGSRSGPVTLGTTQIQSGYWVFADADGVIFSQTDISGGQFSSGGGGFGVGGGLGGSTLGGMSSGMGMGGMSKPSGFGTGSNTLGGSSMGGSLGGGSMGGSLGGGSMGSGLGGSSMGSGLGGSTLGGSSMGSGLGGSSMGAGLGSLGSGSTGSTYGGGTSMGSGLGGSLGGQQRSTLGTGGLTGGYGSSLGGGSSLTGENAVYFIFLFDFDRRLLSSIARRWLRIIHAGRFWTRRSFGYAYRPRFIHKVVIFSRSHPPPFFRLEILIVRLWWVGRVRELWELLLEQEEEKQDLQDVAGQLCRCDCLASLSAMMKDRSPPPPCAF